MAGRGGEGGRAQSVITAKLTPRRGRPALLCVSPTTRAREGNLRHLLVCDLGPVNLPVSLFPHL